LGHFAQNQNVNINLFGVFHKKIAFGGCEVIFSTYISLTFTKCIAGWNAPEEVRFVRLSELTEGFAKCASGIFDLGEK
jgi:hypothetical protein